jgi:hypothetical protein
MRTETVRMIVARDRDRCRGCHDPRRVTKKQKGKVRTVTVPGFEIRSLGPANGETDAADENRFALFCAFCSKNYAHSVGSLEDLPPRAGG